MHEDPGVPMFADHKRARLRALTQSWLKRGTLYYGNSLTEG